MLEQSYNFALLFFKCVSGEIIHIIHVLPWQWTVIIILYSYINNLINNQDILEERTQETVSNRHNNVFYNIK